jgi:hypothetical protein
VAGPERVGALLKSPAAREDNHEYERSFRICPDNERHPATDGSENRRVPAQFPRRFEAQHLKAESVRYRGRGAIHLSATAETKGEPIVILTNSDFENGTIELDLAGR